MVLVMDLLLLNQLRLKYGKNNTLRLRFSQSKFDI